MAIRGIEHIGITVANLQQAELFFINCLEATVLYRLVPLSQPDKKQSGESLKTFNGCPPEIDIVAISMLRLGNSCNIELFQIEPTVVDEHSTPARPNLNHFAVYVDDIHQAAEKMRANVAVLFDGPNHARDQEAGEGNFIWFCLTPFGVLIELITLPTPVNCDETKMLTRWIPEKTNLS